MKQRHSMNTIVLNKIAITEEKANKYLKDIIDYLPALRNGTVTIEQGCARIKVNVEKFFFKLSLDISISILKLFADKTNKILVVKILDCNQYCFIIPILETFCNKIKGLAYNDGVIYFDVQKNHWFKKRVENVMSEWNINSIKKVLLKNGKIEFLTT